jgi:DNA polymerase III delta prime subunit
MDTTPVTPPTSDEIRRAHRLVADLLREHLQRARGETRTAPRSRRERCANDDRRDVGAGRSVKGSAERRRQARDSEAQTYAPTAVDAIHEGREDSRPGARDAEGNDDDVVDARTLGGIVDDQFQRTWARLLEVAASLRREDVERSLLALGLLDAVFDGPLPPIGNFGRSASRAEQESALAALLGVARGQIQHALRRLEERLVTSRRQHRDCLPFVLVEPLRRRARPLLRNHDPLDALLPSTPLLWEPSAFPAAVTNLVVPAIARALDAGRPLSVLLRGPDVEDLRQLVRGLAAHVQARVYEQGTDDTRVPMEAWLPLVLGPRPRLFVVHTATPASARGSSSVSTWTEAMETAAMATEKSASELALLDYLATGEQVKAPPSPESAQGGLPAPGSVGVTIVLGSDARPASAKELAAFTLVVTVPAAPAALVRARMQARWTSSAGVLVADDALLDSLVERRADNATLDHLATLARVWARPPKSDPDGTELRQRLLAALDERVRAGAPRALPAVSSSSSPALRFDADVLATSTPLAAIERGLRRDPRATMLFVGPPGTGKTEAARELGRRLQRVVHTVRASDIIGIFIGEQERNLKAIFAAASSANAILVLDEVDSFLNDRRRAIRSWEVTGVNELLTCLESFPGTFIGTTNRADKLDPAVFRRISLMVRFERLSRSACRTLLEQLLVGFEVAYTDEQLGEWAAIAARLPGLSIGDFQAAAAALRFAWPTRGDDVVAALAERAAWKPGQRLAMD